MAYEHTLSEEQVAERLDEASGKVDKDEAREIASQLQRRGLVVVERDPNIPTVDELVAALDADPNIAAKDESMFPRPNRSGRSKTRDAGLIGSRPVGTGN